jgi:hypothetical protein
MEQIETNSTASYDLEQGYSWSPPISTASLATRVDKGIYFYVNKDAENQIKDNLRDKQVKKDFLYHYLYVLSTIHHLMHVDKRFENKDFVHINYKIMSGIISRKKYTEIMINLINWGIIETNGSYCVGNFSKGYRITIQYNSNIKRIKVNDKLICKKITRYRDQCSKEIKKLPLPYQYLEWTNTLIQIDKTKALDYNIKYFFKEGKQRKYESNHYAVLELSDGQYRFTVDKTGNRAHSNLTNLRKDFRQFITVDGEHLAQIDICNSQPMFLSLLITNNENIPEQEKEKYREIVENGRFYEYILNALGIPLTQREKLKKKILAAILYDKKRKKESRYVKVFRKDFPHIWEYIQDIKKHDHKCIAALLQKTESKFVIQQAVAEFVRRFGDQYVFISTIHDCIVVKENWIDTVQEIMQDCFIAEGINPKMKISYYKKT